MRFRWFVCLFLVGIVFSAQGGPDAFGYRWIDSNEPGGPVFSWIEISTTGTMLSALECDDCYTIVMLSRPFNFYGTDYRRVAVTSNGYMSFDTTVSYYPISATYDSFPSTNPPNLVIAPFNFDQDPQDSPGSIYYQDFGDYVVFEWYQIREYPASPSTHQPSTWEVILNYSRREIIFQYLFTDTMDYHTAYVGIENATGTVGLNIARWSSYTNPPDNYAIRIRATPMMSPPMFVNFELNEADFQFPSGTGWQWGTPVPGVGPSAHSGVKCLGTNLAGNYNNNCDWVTIAPLISISGANYPILDFWSWYLSEEGHDGGVVEYSTNEGATWLELVPESGYPVEMVAGPLTGRRAFSGNSGGWQKVSFDLSGLSIPEFLIRFRFVSDAGTNDAGWYIDDIGVHEAYGVVTGILDLLYTDDNSSAVVSIVDLGRNRITPVDGSFRFDSVKVGTHTICAWKDGYVPLDSLHFEVERGETVYLDLHLAPELYHQNFALNDGGLIPDPINGWQWGKPNPILANAPISAHSDSLCWGTNLNGNYSNNVIWMLTLNTTIGEIRWPVISFWQWYRFQGEFAGTILYDGGNLKVSTDNGVTWRVVEPVGGYDGVISDHNVLMGGQPAFGGVTNGNFWHQVIFPLYEFAGNPTIKIRFDIASDGAGTEKGWYIDDVRIYDDSLAYVSSPQTPRTPFLMIAPNPFNAYCRITYLAEQGSSVKIYDLSGKIVTEFGERNSYGVNTIEWDASGVSAGIYLISVESPGGARIIRKAVVVK